MKYPYDLSPDLAELRKWLLNGGAIPSQQGSALLVRLAKAERVCAIADPMKMADHVDDEALRSALAEWKTERNRA
jgi:hypothetical protein